MSRRAEGDVARDVRGGGAPSVSMIACVPASVRVPATMSRLGVAPPVIVSVTDEAADIVTLAPLMMRSRPIVCVGTFVTVAVAKVEAVEDEDV